MRKIDNLFSNLPGYSCFGCSPENPFGLKLNFSFDEQSGEIVSHLKDTEHFQGFPGVLHGGIQATLMDECGFWIILDQLKKFSFTVNMNVDFKSVLQVPDEITLRAKIIDHDEKSAKVSGKIISGDGKIVTEAILTFFLAGKKMWQKISGEEEIPSWAEPYL